MTELKKYTSKSELSQADETLLDEAIKSREHAYAPYSHFRVGTSLLFEDGTIEIGNNQENAAYPSGLCAERVALFSARAKFPTKKIVAMAIACRHENKHTDFPLTSCGSCRQVMIEYELNQQQPIRLLFYGEAGEVWELPNVKTLLPFFFDKSILRD